MGGGNGGNAQPSGQGGVGGNGEFSGGGGGGGYVGGGGGGSSINCGGGGGGGESHFDPAATGRVGPTAISSSPSVTIRWTIAPPVTTTVNDAGTDQPWSGNETTGAEAYDAASLGGTVSGFTPSGTVTYSFFNDGACSGTAASTQPVTLNQDGTVPNSSTTSAMAAGAYSYRASYSGDGSYAPATGPCESFMVGKARVSVSTQVDDAGTSRAWSGTESSGAKAYDAASLGGTVSGFTPSGTVTYSFFNDGACSGTAASTQPVTLNQDGTVPNSSTTSAMAAGAYSYRASYSGDGSYAPATGPCESFMVGKARVSVSTQVDDAGTSRAWSGTESSGAKAYDAASLGGTVSGFTPSGTVTYSFFNDGACSGTAASTQPVTLNQDGTVPNSSTTSAMAAGAYSYRASYSGDGSYARATGPCESFMVGKARVSVSTQVDDAGTSRAWSGTESSGAKAYDAASLGGTVSGFTPSGTVTYSFFNDGACSGTAASTQPVTLNQDGTVPNSSTTSAMAAGAYSYRASYSGDSNYAKHHGLCEMFRILSIRRAGAHLILETLTAHAIPSGDCHSELYQAASAAVASRQCNIAVVTFAGRLDPRASGRVITVTLKATVEGHRLRFAGRARVFGGRYQITLDLPGRNTDNNDDPRTNAVGDVWSYTISYAGNDKLKPAKVAGRFRLETEPA